MSKAVKTLVDQAELQRAAGDLTGAAATLERALRIEPDSGYVWNRLAHVRAAQGQAGLAGELAAKSNTFAGGDESLRRDNDQLIARSRK
jgi:Tfp pilus assembly protein PilF